MSLRCKIFGHSWNIYRENVTYIISGSINKSMPLGIENTWPIDVRMCLRCYCKQIRNIDVNTVKLKYNWSEWKLTKEELRDKNLKELGI